MGAGGEGKTDGGAGRGTYFNKGSNAHPEIVRAARRVHEPDNILLHPFIEIQRAGDFPGLLDSFQSDYRVLEQACL